MKHKKWKPVFTALAALVLLCIGLGSAYMVTHGAASVTITDIDYDNLTMTIQGNAADSQIFFATSASAAIWDEVPGSLDDKHRIVMDISFVSLTSNYTLYLKGDRSTDPIKVVFPKQNTAFKVTHNKADHTLRMVNLGSAKTVYYKKSTSEDWILYNYNDSQAQKEMANLIETLCLKGATLQFRAGQIRGESQSNTGTRPSNPFSLTIPKRASAPAVKLDYDKLTFNMKKTYEYKRPEEEIWTTAATTSLYLEDALPNAMHDAYVNTVINDPSLEPGDTLSIDVRIKATSSRVASQTKTIAVPGQEKTYITYTDENTGETKNHIYLEYTGSEQCRIKFETLAIKDAFGRDVTLSVPSSSNVYEYTVVKKGEALNTHTANWNSITSATTNLTKSKVPTGSSLYIRKKATSTAVASTTEQLAANITYPNAATVTSTVSIEKIQGVTIPANQFVVQVCNSDVTVQDISFNGTSVSFKATSPVKDKTSGKYNSTVSITDTTALESSSGNLGTKLLATITLNSGEIISRNVYLYIQKASSITNAAYTKYKGFSFENTTDTTQRDTDNIVIDIQLNDSKKEADKVSVSSLSYAGTTLPTTYYTVKKYSGHIELVLLKEAINQNFDTIVKTGNYDRAYAFEIKLSNGEILDKQVTFTVAYPVTASESGYGISLTSYQKYLDDVAEAKKNNANAAASGSEVVYEIPTTYATDPTVTFTLANDVLHYDTGNSYRFVSLKWKGHDIAGTVTPISGADTCSFRIGINLSKLTSYQITGTDYVTLTLKNEQTGKDLIVDYRYQLIVSN